MSAIGSIFPMKKLVDLTPRATVAAAFCLSLAPFLIVELFRTQFFRIMGVPAYLVFHNIAEFFSVMVALSIFGVGWFTYAQSQDRHALFLSAAFLATGGMDFLHALSYAGMPAFISPNSANKSTQFWIAARFLGALSFLVSAYILPDSRSRYLSKTSLAAAALAIPTAAFAGIVFFPLHMPATFIEGVGLTRFKVVSEYLIICLLIFATAAYWRRAIRTGNGLLNYYIAAFVVCIFGELSFAVYMSVYDSFNVLGHLYKAAGFFLIYRGIFIGSIQFPYAGLADAGAKLREDILEREKTEEALRKSERKLSLHLHQTMLAVIEWDSEFRAREWNPAAEKTFGYSREEAIGRQATDLIIPRNITEDIDRVWRQFLAQSGGVCNINENVTKDGRIIVCEWFNTSVTDGRGTVIGVMSFARDITEQNRIHVALQRREEELRTILRTATDGFWITDRKGRFLEVNDAVCRNLGYSRDELLRMSVSDIEAVEKPEEILRSVQRIMERGSDQFEGLHRCKDGSLRNVEVSVNYLPPPQDRFFAFLRDITEHKKLEAQYFQAQKIEAVGTLAGGIAHDFNNSLTGIVGFGELLRMRVAGDGQALHDLDEIQRCAERGATLTRQLLTFARRQVIEPVNLNLNTLVADLMRFIGKVMGEHIEIRTSLEKNVPTIHADHGQIEQVVMNLCLNSRDAMPEGGRLVVETGDVYLDEEYVGRNPYMKTGRYTVLTVSDTGIGMDKNTRERVFEPFFTTKGPDKGTGLGLSMVYGIVKQHGGFIHLYSEPGKGTTFKVYFPAVDAQPDTVPAIRKEDGVRGGTETILLAEDEEAIRSFVERALKEIGYNVLVASTGEEAVEIFRQKKEIALAVLDVVMPRKGGKEAFEEMRRKDPRLKVIFMSGYSPDAIHDSFVLIEGTPFLQKPFSPTMLARKVREVLDSR